MSNIDLGKLRVLLPDTDGELVETDLDLDVILPISQDISGEFTRQPAQYAYVAMLAARAEAAWADAEATLEDTFAQTYQDVRRDFDLSGIKVTETLLKQEIRLKRGYQEDLGYELQMREQHLIMKALTKAMDQRASMLISLGAHLRAERDQTDMHIKDFKEELRGKKRVNRVLTDGDWDPSDSGF